MKLKKRKQCNYIFVEIDLVSQDLFGSKFGALIEQFRVRLQ